MNLFFREHIPEIEAYLQGGGVVMIPLLLISVVMWVLIINRILFFRRLYYRNMSRKEAVVFLKNNEFPDRKKYSGATSQLVTGILLQRTGHREIDRHIIDEVVIQQTSSLDHYLAIINVLAGIAPLLGLLGTVTGMISTFDVISGVGTGNARAMAGGISEALITTQSGLLVAIPGLYMGNFLNRRAEILKNRLVAIGYYLLQSI